MSVHDLLRSVVLTSIQYKNNENNENLTHFLRSIEEIISFSGNQCVYSILSEKMLFDQCIHTVLECLSQFPSKQDLIHRIFVLLNSLVNDETILEYIINSMRLNSVLLLFVRNRSNLSDSSFKECLQLLLHTTKNVDQLEFNSNLDCLLQFVITVIIKKQESDITQSCLGILSNLSYNSKIKNIIQCSTEYEEINKRVIFYLSHTKQIIVIFAHCLYMNLSSDDEIAKLYKSDKLSKTFKLIFNVIITGQSALARRYAIDLLTNLINNSKVKSLLKTYSHINVCIANLVQLLCSDDAEVVGCIAKLLSILCSTGDLSENICNSLFSDSVRSNHVNMNVEKLHSMKSVTDVSPVIALIHWAFRINEQYYSSAFLSLDFLNNIFQKLVSLEFLKSITSYLNLILEMITVFLNKTIASSEGILTKTMCLGQKKCLALLLTFCSNNFLKSLVAQQYSESICKRIIDFQFEYNFIVSANRQIDDPNDWSIIGLEVLLQTLILLKEFSKLHSSKELFDQIILDERLTKFLAAGITSNQKALTRFAMILFSAGTLSPSFPQDVICNCVTKINGSKSSVQYISNMSDSFESNHINSNSKPTSKLLKTSNNVEEFPESEIQLLINKMKSGLEVSDPHTSQIISVYEHRLQSYKIKEDNFKDLIESTSVELLRVKQLLNQYQINESNFLTEDAQLRKMLKESEKRSESSTHKLKKVYSEKEDLELNLQASTEENKRLLITSEKHKELLQTHDNLQQRYDTTIQTLESLRKECESMTEMLEVVRKHNESLKQQQDLSIKQIADFKEENKNITHVLDEKKLKLDELSKKSKEQTKLINKLEKEQNRQDKLIDTLRTQMGKTESKNSSLEATVKSQKAELDQLSNMASLIHNITSGKIQSTSDLSSSR